VTQARVIAVPAGPEAATALASEIYELKSGDPFAPVFVVTPSDPVAMALRKWMAAGWATHLSSTKGNPRDHGGEAEDREQNEGELPPARPGLVSVEFGTSGSLARYIARSRGLRRLPALEARQEQRLVRKALQEAIAEHTTSPRSGGEIADKLTNSLLAPPSWEFLTRCFRHIDRHTTVDRLKEFVDRCEVGAKSGDHPEIPPIESLVVASAYLHFKEYLRNRYDDDSQAFAQAQEAVERTEQSELPYVILYSPFELDLAERGLLGALWQKGRLTIVVGFTGDGACDLYLEQIVRSVTGPSPDFAVSDGDNAPSTRSDGQADFGADIRLITALDPEDEARACLRLQQRWVSEGVDAASVALAYVSPDPYESLLRSLLAQGEIANWGLGSGQVRSTRTYRVLAAAVQVIDSDFRRDRVVEYLSLLPEGARWTKLRNGTEEWVYLDPDVCEQVASQTWRPGGVDSWLAELERPSLSPDSTSKEVQTRIAAGLASFLKDFCATTASLLNLRKSQDADGQAGAVPDEEAKRPTWAELAEDLSSLLAKGAPGEGFSSAGSGAYASSSFLDRILRECEQAATEKIKSWLSNMADFDEISGPPGWDDLLEEIDWIGMMELGLGMNPGNGIFVGKLHDMAGMPVEAVCVMGATSDVLPASGGSVSVLEPIAKAVDNPDLAKLLPAPIEQKVRLLTVIRGARRTALSHPVSELGSRHPKTASPWLLDLASSGGVAEATGDGPGRLLSTHDLIEQSQAFLGGWMPAIEREPGGPWPCDMQEMNCYALWRCTSEDKPEDGNEDRYVEVDLDSGGDTLESALRQVLGVDASDTGGEGSTLASAESLDFAAAGRRLLRMRELNHDRASPWWGLVSLPRSLLERLTVSPTALETWAECPYRYYLSKVLRVERLRRPEEEEDVSPLDLGQLVHKVLETLVQQEFIESESGSSDTADDVASLERRLARLQEAARRLIEDEFKKLARGRWASPYGEKLLKRRVLTAVETACAVNEILLASLGCSPAKVELPLDPHRIQSSETGVQLELRGRIDRVDRDFAGRRLVVIDYKTGRMRSELRSDYRKSMTALGVWKDSAEALHKLSRNEFLSQIGGPAEVPKVCNGGEFLQLPSYLLAISRSDPQLAASRLDPQQAASRSTPEQEAASHSTREQEAASLSTPEQQAASLATPEQEAESRENNSGGETFPAESGGDEMLRLGSPPPSFVGIIWHIDTYTGANELFGLELDSDRLEAVEEFLRGLATTVARGVFPPNPGNESLSSFSSNCRFCDFDIVCPAERVGIWMRKCSAPEYDPYVSLIQENREAAGIEEPGLLGDSPDVRGNASPPPSGSLAW
jgi:hypothetical protein